MTRRWPALVLIPALLVAALVHDGGDDAGGAGRATAGRSAGAVEDRFRAMPVAAPRGALTATWYCAGGTGVEGGGADHTVVIANAGTGTATGTLTAVPSRGEAVEEAVRVPAHGRVEVRLAEVVSAPYVAALVETSGGTVAVEHRVAGPTGVDTAACATSASDRWYFASGSTTRDADEVLVFFNPFPDDAVVDASFVTEEGRRTPDLFRGLPVPGRSVVAVPVTREVTVARQISTTVAVRSGRVIVDRIQSFDGRGAATTEAEAAAEPFRPKGLTVALGVPRPATTWVFPVSMKADGVHERLVVYNPSDDQAEVDVAVTLEEPRRNGEVDPFELSIAPLSFAEIDLDAEARVPPGITHSTVVSSTNGVAVVADRLVATLAPFPSTGTSVSSGSPLAATGWVFADGATVPGQSGVRLAVSNPTGSAVRVRVRAFGEGAVAVVRELGGVTLAAGAHLQVEVGARVQQDDLSLLVTASAPVAAERFLFEVDGGGGSTAIGVPLPGGTTLVPPPTG